MSQVYLLVLFLFLSLSPTAVWWSIY